MDRNSWDVDMDVSRLPTFHFALYVPPPSISPLVIVDEQNDETSGNAFVIPRWGGVVIRNPTGIYFRLGLL